jgi:large subunit ribosomal protein L9
MKVIFLENHDDYKVGEVREIADGFARNFLLPKGIVKAATDEEIKNLEGKIKKLQAEEEKHVAEAQAIADKISAQTLLLKEEVNEEGHLYGAVTPKEIADALAAKGFEIDGSDIVMEDSIHDMGDFSVIVRTGHGVETELKVKVERNK